MAQKQREAGRETKVMITVLYFWLRVKTWLGFTSPDPYDIKNIDLTTINPTFMTDKLFYVKDSKVLFKKKILVYSIGEFTYRRWRKIDKFFHIHDAMSAAHFLVYIYSNVDCIHRNPTFCKYLSKRYNIDDEFLLLYANWCNIELEIKRNQWEAYYANPNDPKDILYGRGETILSALGNLQFELSIFLTQTFIP